MAVKLHASLLPLANRITLMFRLGDTVDAYESSLCYPYRSAVSAGLFSLKVGVLLRLSLLLGHGSLPTAHPPGDGRPDNWPNDILCHTISMRLAVASNLLSIKSG